MWHGAGNTKQTLIHAWSLKFSSSCRTFWMQGSHPPPSEEWSRFFKGGRRHVGYPCRPTLPFWDLELNLWAMTGTTFEPLETAKLKWLSLKTTFLLALASAKKVRELQFLLIDLCRLLPAGAGVVLWPNPTFLPKVLSDSQPSQEFEIRPLYSSQTENKEHRHHLVCSVRSNFNQTKKRVHSETVMHLSLQFAVYVLPGKGQLHHGIWRSSII